MLSLPPKTADSFHSNIYIKAYPVTKDVDGAIAIYWEGRSEQKGGTQMCWGWRNVSGERDTGTLTAGTTGEGRYGREVTDMK